MFKQRRLIAVGLVASLALVGAACSDDDDEATTTGSGDGESSETTDTTASDGSPIVVGGVGTLLGFSGVSEGAQARFDRANAEGGVNGHKIEFIGTTDDGGDPANNNTAVRELVQQKKVDAVLPLLPTNFQAPTAQFLAEQNIPYIGLGYGPAMCQIESGFPFNGCTAPNIAKGNSAALVQFLPAAVEQDDLEGIKIAVIGSVATGGDAYLKSVSSAVEDLGAEIVVSEPGVPAGATNVQPYVDAVLAGDADMVIIVTDFVAMLSIQGTLKANGYKGALVNFAGYIPGILETSADLQKGLEGSYIATVLPTPLDGSPASKELTADLEAADVNPTFGALVGWQSADLYLQLLDAAGGDASKVVEVGNDGFTFKQPEGGFNVSFPDGHTERAECSGLVTVKSGKYELVEPFTCKD